jgi:hypothetical protein
MTENHGVGGSIPSPGTIAPFQGRPVTSGIVDNMAEILGFSRLEQP